MSNPWSDIYKDLREPYLEGLDPVGKEDGDVNNDGKKDSSDSYLMKRRKAIAKAMGKEDKMKKVKNEHHQKDADGNPIEHGDGTPSNVEDTYTSAYLDELSKKTLGSYVKKASKETRGNMIATQRGSGIPKKARDIKQKQVFKRLKGMEKAGEKLEKKEGYEVNLGDKEANTPAYQGLMSGKKNVLTGKPLYKAGVSLKKAHYEPPKVNKPNYSNWREDFIWDDNVDEAAKGKKLDVKENGVKNKIQINPDDGLKEEKKKLIEKDIYLPSDSGRTEMGIPKRLPKEIIKRKDKPLTGPIYHSASYDPKGNNINELLGGVPGDGYLGHPVLNIKNPLAKTQIKKPVMPGSKGGGLINKTAGQMGDYNMQIQKLMQTNSFKPDGEMTEAKVDQGKSESDKINTRNQRTYGNRRGQKGGMHTGDDMEKRRYNTKAGRGVKLRGQKDKRPMNYHKRDKDARLKTVFKDMGISTKSFEKSKREKNKLPYRTEGFFQKKYAGVGKGYETVGKNKRMDKSNKRSGDSKAQYRELHKGEK